MLTFLLSMVETEEERTFIEQFYFEHKDQLLGYAYNQARATKLSNDRAYAEELVQETFFGLSGKSRFSWQWSVIKVVLTHLRHW